MIDSREAVTTAVTKFNELYRDSGYYDIKLEELELTDNDMYWVVTISFMRPQSDAVAGTEGPASELLKGISLLTKHRRDFKTIQIDADTGAFRSMRVPRPVTTTS
jgi:hypothetical protein